MLTILSQVSAHMGAPSSTYYTQAGLQSPTRLEPVSHSPWLPPSNKDRASRESTFPGFHPDPDPPPPSLFQAHIPPAAVR